jgi:short-subunit dehydrogenase
LAQKGFNICIIARNESKMIEKVQAIKKQFPKIETMYITIDFSKLTTINEYEDKVLTRLKDLDVSILALNAGIGGTETS